MKKIVFLLFSCTTLLSFAQEDRQIVIVQREKYKQKRTPQDNMPRRLVDLDNVFKFDPFRMMIGEINFAYERVIDQQSSIEIELGPTISNLGSARFGFGNNGSQYTVTSAVGVFSSVAFKFYPLDGRPALNQFYVSPKFKYRRYNEWSVPGDLSLLDDKKGFSNESIFTFNFGYQQWLASRFSLDYYFGIGISSRNVTRYELTTEYMEPNWIEKWTPNSYRDSRFVATIGIKVGIGK